MSGGGGSGGIGPGGPRETPCEALQFSTSLTSPDPAIVETLDEGAVLQVALQPAAGGRNMIAVLLDDQVVGAITERTADLIRCMQEGVTYEAEVRDIEGGWVELTVRPA